MKSRSLSLALAAAFLVFGCGAGKPASDADAALMRRVDGEIPRLMAAAEIPGLAIAVVRGGAVVWAKGYGVTNTEHPQPVTADTIFEAASLSKPVFTLAFLKFLDDTDAFGLDAPLAQVFAYERLSHERERYGRLTPRLILSHRTGLPNWGRDGLSFERDPGTRFGYSGEGFVLLQKAVENHTGQSLDKFIRARVFISAGMRNSGYIWRPAFENDVADGHNGDGEITPVRRYGTEGEDGANAAFSLLTNANDFGKFLAYVMRGGDLGKARWREMLAWHTGMTGEETKTQHSKEIWSKIGWGLSWGIQDVGGERIFWHWGDNDIYRSFTAFSLEKKTGFIYFTNSQNGLKIANKLAVMILGDMHWTVSWLGYGTIKAEEP